MNKPLRLLGLVALGLTLPYLAYAPAAPAPRQPGLRVTLEGHTDEVLCVAFSPDNKLVATGSADKTVRVWEVESGRCKLTLEHGAAVRCVAFSPDGRKVAAGHDLGKAKAAPKAAAASGEVSVWDLPDGKTKASLKPVPGLTSLAFSSDGKTVFAGGYGARAFDLGTAGLRWTQAGGTRATALFALSPSGSGIVTGRRKAGKNGGYEISSHRPTTGEILLTINIGTQPGGLAVTADGERIALVGVGEKNTGVRLLDTAGHEKAVLEGHTRQVTAATFSPDGKTLATLCDLLDEKDKPTAGELILWDTGNGREFRKHKIHADRVTDIRFSPDGSLMATTSADKTVKIWATPSLK